MSRGHVKSLKWFLEFLSGDIGKERLEALLAKECGKEKLNAVDTALRTNMPSVPALKRFGGVEGSEAPQGWKQGRRRGTEPDPWASSSSASWSTWGSGMWGAAKWS